MHLPSPFKIFILTTLLWCGFNSLTAQSLETINAKSINSPSLKDDLTSVNNYINNNPSFFTGLFIHGISKEEIIFLSIFDIDDEDDLFHSRKHVRYATALLYLFANGLQGSHQNGHQLLAFTAPTIPVGLPLYLRVAVQRI